MGMISKAGGVKCIERLKPDGGDLVARFMGAGGSLRGVKQDACPRRQPDHEIGLFDHHLLRRRGWSNALSA